MADKATAGEMRFVLASLVIPDGPKLLWLQYWVLDKKGHGCWLDNHQMGERLGKPAKTIEDYHTDLMRYGLLERHPPGKTVARAYKAIWPGETGFRFAGSSPDPDTVIRGREALDYMIGRWRPRSDSASAGTNAGTMAGRATGKDAGKAPGIRAGSRHSSAFASQADTASSASQASEANDVSCANGKSKADELTERELSEAAFVSLPELRRRAREARPTKISDIVKRREQVEDS